MTHWSKATKMRVWKDAQGDITRYRHDGQMGIEDAEAPFGGGTTTVTRYGLGPGAWT